MSPQPIPILLYHAISETSDPRFAEWTVTPDAFDDQLCVLADDGYRTLTVSEFVERAFERREQLDPRTVVITFDDGFADFRAEAWPRLRALSMTATVFVATRYAGGTSRWLIDQGEAGRPMLSWRQIEELAEAGIEFGSHGHSHRQLDTLSAGKTWWELARSREALGARVGAVASLAYPHGYYTREVQRQASQLGFSSACSVKDALSSTEDDRFALARAVVRRGTDLSGFRRLLRGEGLRVAPGPHHLSRGAWRIARRAGAEPLFERLRIGGGSTRVRGDR
jgi:peptidoglycan/xylan/chitin deacetylase (PgdA/CDA1 family)